MSFETAFENITSSGIGCIQHQKLTLATIDTSFFFLRGTVLLSSQDAVKSQLRARRGVGQVSVTGAWVSNCDCETLNGMGRLCTNNSKMRQCEEEFCHSHGAHRIPLSKKIHDRDEGLCQNFKRINWACYVSEVLLVGVDGPVLYFQTDNMRIHLIYKFNTTLAQPDLLTPLPPSPPLPRFLLSRMILTVKYVRVRLTNVKCSFVTYVTQNGIRTISSHPSPPSQFGLGNVRYVPFATPYPRQQHDTSSCPPQFSIPTLSKHPKKRKGKRKKNKNNNNGGGKRALGKNLSLSKPAFLGCQITFTNKKL